MKTFLTLLLVLSLWNLQAQSTIAYTVDPDFNTQETLRSKTSVFDIYPLEDGGFFLGGGFTLVFTNPDSPFGQGLAMVTNSGNTHPEWNGGGSVFAREVFDHQGGYIHATGETLTKNLYDASSWFQEYGDTWGDYYKVQPWGIGNNPYNVRWTWDIFILEDQSVLIGGAIATDTLQPGLFRHLMRLLPDGSHDDTFPIVEAMPQGLNTHISKIERASDGSWYVSGRFEGINGHISPHIAKLNSDFTVDTEFVSPFFYESICCGLHTEMKLMDSQERLWFSGDQVRLAENPDEVLDLVRLLPDGTVDPEFSIGRIEANYPGGWFVPPTLVSKIIEPDLEADVFFLSGVFSHYNDTAQPAITAINDGGYIQENYFGNQGSTVNSYDPNDPTDYDAPSIRALEYLSDGSLMVGGSFSDFMGAERYSMVKLIQGTVSTSDQDRLKNVIKVYPNPARDRVTIQLVTSDPLSVPIKSLQIVDLSGRTVASYPWQGETQTIDIGRLAVGVYLLQLRNNETILGAEKLVVQH
jgi:hypothetical protein